MAQPTTRRARYLFYKARQFRKQRRRRNSYPFTRTFPVNGTIHGNVNGPIEFLVRHAKQRRLKDYLVKPHAIVGPLPPGLTWTEYPASRFVPPHVRIGLPGGPPPEWHSDETVLGYHRKPYKSLGRKVDRMNGAQRELWYATLSAIEWELETGTRYYPEWDPLGRTPTRDPHWLA